MLQDNKAIQGKNMSIMVHVALQPKKYKHTKHEPIK